MNTARARKARYDVGDRVTLYPEPTHEGPHPDDEFAHVPEVTILEVRTYTPPFVTPEHFTAEEIEELTCVTGYLVVEQGLYGREEYTIKPGQVSGLIA